MLYFKQTMEQISVYAPVQVDGIAEAVDPV